MPLLCRERLNTKLLQMYSIVMYLSSLLEYYSATYNINDKVTTPRQDAYTYLQYDVSFEVQQISVCGWETFILKIYKEIITQTTSNSSSRLESCSTLICDSDINTIFRFLKYRNSLYLSDFIPWF